MVAVVVTMEATKGLPCPTHPRFLLWLMGWAAGRWARATYVRVPIRGVPVQVAFICLDHGVFQGLTGRAGVNPSSSNPT